MSDQSKPLSQMLYESAPSSRQIVKFTTAATIASIFIVLSGLTLTATVLVLILSTPILVLFSPVLVPAVAISSLVVAGFFFSGGCGVTAIAALSWMYRYVKGKQPVGAEQIDKARHKIAKTARELKERAKEYVQTKEANQEKRMENREI